MRNEIETLIAFGGAVKSLGGDKFGGHLVLFSTKDDPDLSKQFFDAKTDFDIVDGETRTVYYNHGLDPTLGNMKLGRATIKADAAGLWMEGQISARGKYADAVMKLLDDGELGLSSGALAHLVRTENATKTVEHITHWPIGEGSLTPTPAEPRTLAMPLKSWAAMLKGSILGDHVEEDMGCKMALTGMRHLNEALMSHAYKTLYPSEYYYGEQTGGTTLSDEDKINAMHAGIDEHGTTAKRMIRAVLSGDVIAAKALLAEAFAVPPAFKTAQIATARELEQMLRDAGLSKRQAVAVTNHGIKGLLRDAAGTSNENDLDHAHSRLAELKAFAVTLPL